MPGTGTLAGNNASALDEPADIAFLHTAAAHVATFEALMAALTLNGTRSLPHSAGWHLLGPCAKPL
jgi:hypothetical protein